MTAIEVLTELRGAGIRVEPRPNGNLYIAPKDRLTPELLETVRRHKAELLALLTAPTLSDREEDTIDRVARADGWSPPAEIPPAIASEIRRIEAQALSLGWAHVRLWNFAFWPHHGAQPRGLASVMEPGDRVTEVAADFMLIEKSNSRWDRRRFWRTDG